MRSARDMRRRSAGVRKPSGISATSAAVCVRYEAESKREKGRMPHTPSRRFFQKSSSVPPIEVTAPMPVMTTRRFRFTVRF